MSDIFRAPTKMIVMVDDQPQTRNVDYYDAEQRRYIPELEEDEELMWFTGQIEPVIIKGQREL